MARNPAWLEGGGWVEIEQCEKELSTCRARAPATADVAVELHAAALVEASMGGFGPRQPRNLWQGLGYTRHGIPTDSGITRSLNGIAFSIGLLRHQLADGALPQPAT